MPQVESQGCGVRLADLEQHPVSTRAARPGVRDEWLARGPGNLCRTLGVTATLLGASLAGPDVVLVGGPAPDAVVAGPRVNVSRAHDRPWRFHAAGDPTVSAHKWHPAARPASG